MLGIFARFKSLLHAPNPVLKSANPFEHVEVKTILFGLFLCWRGRCSAADKCRLRSTLFSRMFDQMSLRERSTLGNNGLSIMQECNLIRLKQSSMKIKVKGAYIDILRNLNFHVLPFKNTISHTYDTTLRGIYENSDLTGYLYAKQRTHVRDPKNKRKFSGNYCNTWILSKDRPLVAFFGCFLKRLVGDFLFLSGRFLFKFFPTRIMADRGR